MSTLPQNLSQKGAFAGDGLSRNAIVPAKLTVASGRLKLTPPYNCKTRAGNQKVYQKKYQWIGPGDVNAFFGLMLDNIADLLLTVGLLAAVFEFPTKFALEHMVPGTAIGVLVGDLAFFVMALTLAKRLAGKQQVTAMPLGLDTPSTFGMVFFVLGPAFVTKKAELMGISPQLSADEVVQQAAVYTWHIGICSIVISGVFKFACAFASNWLRSLVPRAGMLGSLSAVALVLISFLPLLEVMHFPVAGLAALAVILTALVARVKLPFGIPGAFGALLVGALIYYGMNISEGLITGTNPHPVSLSPITIPTGWLSVFAFNWVNELPDAIGYLPVVIPFALGTVIGGIDCTESASAAGDDYNTDHVIGVEAFATLVAGLCGGVIQTTPYIGHPAYKAMGGRAAYTLATALFVGSAGLLGYFGILYELIPKAAVFPILIFIGLEITAQSFHATPKRHYAAIALACVPAMAQLVLINTDQIQGQYSASVSVLNAEIQALDKLVEEERQDEPSAGTAKALDRIEAKLDALKETASTHQKFAGAPPRVGEPPGPLGKNLQTVRMLANGFIVTSLLWASALAALIDRRFVTGASFFGIAAVCSLFGVMHSPIAGSPLVNPFDLPATLPGTAHGQTPIFMAAGYLAMAAVCLGMRAFASGEPIEPDTESSPE